jgi:hypothetical protein
MALGMTLAVSSIAMAQSDLIGATPMSQSAVLVIKAVAVAGVAFGFIRLMGGHRIEGLTTMGVGALGVGKSATIATAAGLG